MLRVQSPEPAGEATLAVSANCVEYPAVDEKSLEKAALDCAAIKRIGGRPAATVGAGGARAACAGLQLGGGSGASPRLTLAQYGSLPRRSKSEREREREREREDERER